MICVMALLVSYFIAFKSLTDRPSTPSLFFAFRSSIILIVVYSLMGNSDNVFKQGLVRKFLYVTLVVLSISRASLSPIFEKKKDFNSSVICLLSFDNTPSSRKHSDISSLLSRLIISLIVAHVFLISCLHSANRAW